MDPEYKHLYNKAFEAASNSYCPYSKFRVGAALLTDKGNVYTGVNIENASYGATICAERSAISAAITAGERKFKAIAVVSPDGEAYPCGICCQVIYEFGEEIDIITGSSQDSLDITNVGTLLPKGFKL